VFTLINVEKSLTPLDFLKSIVYIGFFVILLLFHGFPLYIMRDLYITVRSFCKRVLDFIQYRNATRDMHARYPDATSAELESDNTCIICREEMTAWDAQQTGEAGMNERRREERQRPKKLPCGHILHFGCLRSWLERQRVCPTCRRSVLVEDATQQRTQGTNVQNTPAEGNNPPVGNQNTQPNQVQNANPPQRPAPNVNRLRVFNFGPLRIAFGRTAAPLRGPLPQADNRPAVGGQHPPLGIMPQLQSPLPTTTPFLIHQQILQLQGQVIQLMQQLNGEHLQLDVLERLVAELTRLQSEQTRGQLNPQTPQAYQGHAQYPPMSPGSTDLPAGLVLPPGYTLQRLHPVSNGQGVGVPVRQSSSSGGSIHVTPTSPVAEPSTESSDTASASGVESGAGVATEVRHRSTRTAHVSDG
jgi:E3 ubiquitin-protein ligase synoviolin